MRERDKDQLLNWIKSKTNSMKTLIFTYWYMWHIAQYLGTVPKVVNQNITVIASQFFCFFSSLKSTYAINIKFLPVSIPNHWLQNLHCTALCHEPRLNINFLDRVEFVYSSTLTFLCGALISLILSGMLFLPAATDQPHIFSTLVAKMKPKLPLHASKSNLTIKLLFSIKARMFGFAFSRL